MKKMDREYFEWFLIQFGFPKQAVDCLLSAFEKTVGDATACKRFEEIISRYDKDVNADFVKMIDDAKKVPVNGVHPFTSALIILILASKKLKERYGERNISVEVWKNSMNDLLYKCIECRLVYGVWGTFVDWFGEFYNFTRFGLGKLQFEFAESPTDFQNGEMNLKTGDKILKVHIPRTGTRLEREEQIKAYKQASEFFKDYFVNGKIYFACKSWLLFPPLKKMLKPSSNLLAFISDYTVIQEGEYDNFSHWAWRLYDTGEKNIDKLPQDTSLRKNYVDYIKSGKKSGWGFGVFEFKKN